MNAARRVAGAVLVLSVTATAADASAVSPVGSTRPDIRLVDAWERTFDLTQVGARPLLVVYEDEDAVKQNAPFKEELSRLAKGDRYRTKIVLAAVADVAGYDYWPVRGFVKDAIRDESIKAGTPIYCDWNGAVRRAIGARPATSTVILYDRDGKAVFAHEGSMPEATRATLLATLRRMVEVE